MWEHRLPSSAPGPGANLRWVRTRWCQTGEPLSIPQWRKVRAHVRLHEALRTQWNGGCFPARAARPETVQVGDVLSCGGGGGAAVGEAECGVFAASLRRSMQGYSLYHVHEDSCCLSLRATRGLYWLS